MDIWTQRGKGRVGRIGRLGLTNTLPCVKQWEPAIQHWELSLVLCGDLDGWDGGEVGGRSKREGIYVYVYS